MSTFKKALSVLAACFILTTIVVSALGPVLAAGQQDVHGVKTERTSRIPQRGPTDPGDCPNTVYTMNRSGVFSGKNSAGYVRIYFDSTWSCIVVETDNARVVVANAIRSNAVIGITTVDATHYRLYSDGRAIRGELSLALTPVVPHRRFAIMGTSPSVYKSGTDCPSTGYYFGWTNERSFGFSDKGLYYAAEEPGRHYSGFEWAFGINEGTNCVAMRTNGHVTSGLAMYLDGTPLGVWVDTTNNVMVVYTYDGSDLYDFMWAIANSNDMGIRGLIGQPQP